MRSDCSQAIKVLPLAAKRIQHNGVSHRGVQNRIGEQRNRFHCRMVSISLGLWQFPDGGFFPPCIPLMLAFLFQPNSTGSCCHLYGERPSTRESFSRYNSQTNKTGIREGFSKIKPFGVGMEYIDGGIVCYRTSSISLYKGV